MAPTIPTLTPCRGTDRGGIRRSSAPQAAKPGAAPQRLQSLLIRGGGAPDVHVSLVTSDGHGPIPAVAEAGGQPPSERGSELLPLRQRTEAE
jgi:hypothetical protein